MSILSYFRRRRAIRELSAPTSPIRLEAVHTLESLADDKSRKALEAVLLNHIFPGIQAAAARALGCIAHPASADALKKVLAPGFFPIRRGSGFDIGDEDARDRARVRAAAENALKGLRKP